ncbi:hypothetical protein [Microbacterium sp. LWO13-1.2]|uniref:hypothetical protein n=1 Tax=Microbacterium sp. LWO13-1.2 TaxID=3135262 RepID=UPI00313A4448
MTQRYSVISNPHLEGIQVPERTLETGDALGVLTGRQFHVCGDIVLGALPYVDPHAGGVFVTGAYGPSRVQRLRRQFPTVPFMLEPRSLSEYRANEDAPFLIDIGDNELFPATLDAALDKQRLDMGSDLAITPTGQFRTGDTDTVRKALEEVNALDRKDVLFAAAFEGGWLNDEQNVKFIRSVINRSNHPVLLSFVGTANPMGGKKRIRAYRRIMEESTRPVVAYRTDMAGFDARALGAIASAIGALPSARRLTPPGSGGSPDDPTDLAPHELIGDMLRFVRSKEMRRRWFAEAEPILCFCVVCRGRSIDRFTHLEADRREGHLHTVAELTRMHSSTIGMTQLELKAHWGNLVRGALDAYEQLEEHIGVQLGRPNDLQVWAEGIA